MFKRTTLAIITLLALFLVAGCSQAQAEPGITKIDFKYVHDWSEPKVPSGAVRIAQEQEAKAAEIEAQEAEEEYYEEEYYSYTSNYVGYRGDPDGLNNFNGVYEYDGRIESFYSGQAVYTNDLTVDDEGFYRTEEGYYAVATNSGDYSIGDTFEGSQGTCIVVDDGASPGVTDSYVSGWY